MQGIRFPRCKPGWLSIDPVVHPIETTSETATEAETEPDIKFRLQESEREKARLEDRLASTVKERGRLLDELRLSQKATQELTQENNQYLVHMQELEEEIHYIQDINHGGEEYVLEDEELKKKLEYLTAAVTFLQEQTRQPGITLNALIGSIVSLDVESSNQENLDIVELKKELKMAQEQLIPETQFKLVVERLMDAAQKSFSHQPHDDRQAAQGEEERVSLEKYQRVKVKYKQQAQCLRKLQDRVDELNKANRRLMRECIDGGNSNSPDSVILSSELDALRRTKAYHEETISSLEKRVEFLSKLKGIRKENTPPSSVTSRQSELKETVLGQKDSNLEK